VRESNEGLSCLGDVCAKVKLDRRLLKDRAADMLRNHISSGRIPEGTKLTEREVSQLLGISRMPARDALLALEAEGLVVTRPDGRYVVELTSADVRNLHVLRETLERLAVRLAAAHIDEANRAELRAAMASLKAAVTGGDGVEITRADMALHRTIWRQADNPHLLRVLDSMLGAVFVMAERLTFEKEYDRVRMMDTHTALVEHISEGDGDAAAKQVEKQIRASLDFTLRTHYPAPNTEKAINS